MVYGKRLNSLPENAMFCRLLITITQILKRRALSGFKLFVILVTFIEEYFENIILEKIADDKRSHTISKHANN